jgi:hypothetical protein
MRWFAVLLPAAALIVLIVSVVLDYNLNFDEGYNLQIPRNLLRHGRYGSETLEGFHAFDPKITTGPLVLAPIAPVVAVFGIGITQARIVPALYALALVTLLPAMVWRRHGHLASAATLVLLLLANDVVILLGHVFGETAGIVWWLIGVLLIRRAQESIDRWGFAWAGLAFAAAVWAKPSLAVATLATAVLLFGVAWTTGRRGAWGAALIAVIGTGLWFSLPVLLGQPDQTLFSQEGSELVAQQLSDNILGNLARNSAVSLSTLMPAVLLATAWRLVEFWRKRSLDDTGDLLLTAVPLVWIVWWLLLNRDGITRHAVPAVIIGIVPLVVWAVDHSARGWRLGLLAVALSGPLLLVTPGPIRHWTQLAEIRERRKAQVELAVRVNQLAEPAQIFGWRWYLAWDIAFLSNRTFGDLAVARAVTPDAYLVLTPTITRDRLELDALNLQLQACTVQTVVDTGQDYRLIRLTQPCR